MSKEDPVKLESLQSCLSGLSSQDSGIGSSQEFPSLHLDKIVVPNHLTTSNVSNSKTALPECSSIRKRHYSESSLSEYEDGRELKRTKVNDKEPGLVEVKNQSVDVKAEGNENDESLAKRCASLPAHKELCIMCNENPKNSIFLHGRIAHMCCCYKCAMRTWGMNKRCPVCNCKVRNVVKVFTI